MVGVTFLGELILFHTFPASWSRYMVIGIPDNFGKNFGKHGFRLYVVSFI